jgi:hypoxanthine phosphoribosyltransferase
MAGHLESLSSGHFLLRERRAQPQVLLDVQLLRPRLPLAGRHLLVVEDIVDTGRTTSAVLRYLARQRPASVRLCALLSKPSRREVPVVINYLGMNVPDLFVVGYGLDAAEQHRNLPYIAYLEQ